MASKAQNRRKRVTELSKKAKAKQARKRAVSSAVQGTKGTISEKEMSMFTKAISGGPAASLAQGTKGAISEKDMDLFVGATTKRKSKISQKRFKDLLKK